MSAWTGLQTDQPPVKTASGAPRTSFRFETPPRASRRPQVTDRRLDAEVQPPTEPPSCVTLSTLRDTGQGAAAVPHQQSLKQQLPSNNFTASRPYFKKKKKKRGCTGNYKRIPVTARPTAGIQFRSRRGASTVPSASFGKWCCVLSDNPLDVLRLSCPVWERRDTGTRSVPDYPPPSLLPLVAGPVSRPHSFVLLLNGQTGAVRKKKTEEKREEKRERETDRQTE